MMRRSGCRFAAARTEPSVTRCSPPRRNGTFPAENISSARPSIIASAGSGAPNGSSMSPESKTLASSSRSRSCSIEYVSMPNDSARIAAGPKRVPGRNDVVESYGAPNRTTRDAAKSSVEPMKACLCAYIMDKSSE